jgi:undecaprenyl-diphosphatase
VGWDLDVLEAVAAHRTWWATDLARAAMAAGNSSLTYLAAVGLCVVFGWRFRAWRPAVAAPLAAGLAIAVALAAKGVFDRPRPPEMLALATETSSSMPSSIAAMTAAAATPLILAALRLRNRTGRLLVWLLALITLGIGISMVYLGAHWLSDVLVGWLVGVGVGAVVFRLIAGPVRGTTVPQR